jgi:hypothetical protein
VAPTRLGTKCNASRLVGGSRRVWVTAPCCCLCLFRCRWCGSFLLPCCNCPESRAALLHATQAPTMCVVGAWSMVPARALKQELLTERKDAQLVAVSTQSYKPSQGAGHARESTGPSMHHTPTVRLPVLRWLLLPQHSLYRRLQQQPMITAHTGQHSHSSTVMCSARACSRHATPCTLQEAYLQTAAPQCF